LNGKIHRIKFDGVNVLIVKIKIEKSFRKFVNNKYICEI